MIRKAFCVTAFLFILTTVFTIPVRMEMMNGDEFTAELITDEIMFITDYTELSIGTGFISRIVFPRPGYRTTEIRTIYKEEIFGGFILNDSFKLTILGKELKINRDKISAIFFHENSQRELFFNTKMILRTGDSFYGMFIQENITIETSYQNIEIPISEVDTIEFEGEGKIITTVTMKNTNQFKGVIKDEFLSLETVYNPDMLLVPDKVKTIHFPEEKTNPQNHQSTEVREIKPDVSIMNVKENLSIINLDSKNFRIKLINPDDFFITVLLLDHTGGRGTLLFPNQYAKENYYKEKEAIVIPSNYASLNVSDKTKKLVVYFSKSQFDDYIKWEKLFLLGRSITISTDSLETKLNDATFSDFYKFEVNLSELF
ncbi:MAG TPA: hypothetical protein P5107_11565 [Thermotogota bacterium]|nr:hypothetical protein [Thermotogota bacterium]